MIQISILRSNLIFLCTGLLFFSCSREMEKVEESYPDGKPKMISYYKEGDPAKKTSETGFYEDGKEKIKGAVKEDKRNGKWTFWYPNGKKWSECEYKDGIKHGKTVTWFENGKMRYEGEYVNDARKGNWKFYDETGKLVREESFKLPN